MFTKYDHCLLSNSFSPSRDIAFGDILTTCCTLYPDQNNIIQKLINAYDVNDNNACLKILFIVQKFLQSANLGIISKYMKQEFLKCFKIYLIIGNLSTFIRKTMC